MIFEKLSELISEQFGVEPDTITMETTFEDDLGADSLDIVELSMAWRRSSAFPRWERMRYPPSPRWATWCTISRTSWTPENRQA